jgi:centromere protein J
VKKNKIPRGPESFDAPPAPEASATEEAEHGAMRVSVRWASARDGADDVLGATAHDGAGENSADAVNPRDPRDSIDVDVDVDARAKEGGKKNDLDDVPVSGAPQASFDALLEASLASASDPRAATPASPSTTPKPLPPQDASSGVTMSASQEKTPPLSSASSDKIPRPFLRRGDRQRKIADDAKAKRAGEFVSAPATRSSTRPAANTSAERSSREISRSAPRSASKKSAREEDELAEFEALERELLLSTDANDDEKETRSEASAAAESRKAGRSTSNAFPKNGKRAGTHRASVEKAKLAAAMRSVRLDSDDDTASDADSRDDDVSGNFSARSGALGRTGAASQASRDRPKAEGGLRDRAPLASPTPPAFDDGDSWDDDAFGGVADAFGGRSPPRAKAARSSPAKSPATEKRARPGEGAPELIKSLFYGASKAGASEPRSRAPKEDGRGVLRAERREAKGPVSSARAAADAAAAAEAAAAARDAADAVRRERERLEKEKSAFAKEKRAAAKDLKSNETRLAEARDELESQKQKLEAQAERVRRDRQRLERDARRAAEAGSTTKRERTELESLREALAKATDEAKAKDAKHRAAADRLRRQVNDLRDEVDELKGEKRRLEQTLLRRQKGAGDAEREKRRGAGAVSKRDLAREQLELAREARERRDREEMEKLAREQRERRAREEARERDSLLRDEEDASDEEDARSDSRRGVDSEPDSDASLSDSFRVSKRRERDTVKDPVDSLGVSAVEAAAAHRVPSVRDAPPRVGPPPAVSDAEHSCSGLGAFDVNRHEDGRVERVSRETGRRVVTFANGTVKDVVPSAEGSISTVYFTNGDVKRAHPGGRVEYFYKEVDTWHTTHPEGVEVYHFPSGQTEAHGADGRKEILFPDGLLRRVYPDGREEDEPAP